MKKLSINLKDPRFRVPIVVTIIVLGGMYLWYQQFYEPIRSELRVLQNKKETKQDTLRVVQALKPQLAQLRQELIGAQSKLDSLKSIFPDQKEIPKLLREITAVAHASGITTTKFNPLPDVEREYYVENRYNISVRGGYHDLADFFAFLANFTLIINLSSVNIAGNPEYTVALSEEMNRKSNATIVAMFEMTTFSSKKVGEW